MKKKSLLKITTISLISRYFLYSFAICFFSLLFVGGFLIKWLATSPTSSYDIDYFRSDLILMFFLFIGMIIISSISKTKIKFYGFAFGLFVAIWLALVYYHIGVFI